MTYFIRFHWNGKLCYDSVVNPLLESLKIYLKELQIEEGGSKGKGGARVPPSADSSPGLGALGQAEAGSLEFHPDLLHGCQWPSYLGQLVLPSQVN